MTLKVPAFLVQHPTESLMAAALLLGLLFISADGTAPLPAAKPLQVATEKTEKSLRPWERSFWPIILYPERTSDPERPQPANIRPHPLVSTIFQYIYALLDCCRPQASIDVRPNPPIICGIVCGKELAWDTHVKSSMP
jgi:hypothetical protein